jgi:hypothetical protein
MSKREIALLRSYYSRRAALDAVIAALEEYQRAARPKQPKSACRPKSGIAG